MGTPRTTMILRQVQILNDILAERARQDAKWGGERDQPNGTGGVGTQMQAQLAKYECDFAFSVGFGSWNHILREELYEAAAETDPARLRAELVQVAAVAMAWIENLDRKTAATKQVDS